MGAAAAAAANELRAACRSIAEALDVPQAVEEKLEADPASLTKDGRLEWCDVATTAIKAGLVGHKMRLRVRQPTCAVSVAAKAACQAKCVGAARCDLKENPPKCIADDTAETSARLEVACRGECTPKPGKSLSCFGVCVGKCHFMCNSPGGVACEGACEGSCEGVVDPEGVCHGLCRGRCAITEVGATCNGVCMGACDGSCFGSPDASAKCDGDCKADLEPLKCWGGELAGGCVMDARCESSCNVSVKAKAECRQPVVHVDVSPLSPRAAQLVVALEKNLPIIYSLQQRVDGIYKAAAELPVMVRESNDIDPACAPSVVAATRVGLSHIYASVSACQTLLGAVEYGHSP